MAVITATATAKAQPSLVAALARAGNNRVAQATQVAKQVGPPLIAAAAPARRSLTPEKRPLPSLSNPAIYDVRITPHGTGTQVQFYVRGSNDLLAKFHSVNSGAGAHGIDARNAPFLVFPGTNQWAGQIIKTRHVNHPGNAGANFYLPAVRQAMQMVLASLH